MTGRILKPPPPELSAEGTIPLSAGEPVVERVSWERFRDSGLLWYANRALMVFGYAIVLNVDENTGEVVDAYPARVPWTGFAPENDTRGRARLLGTFGGRR